MSTIERQGVALPAKRRWFQFTLAGLLLFTLICALVVGIGAMFLRQIALEQAKALAARRQAETAMMQAEMERMQATLAQRQAEADRMQSKARVMALEAQLRQAQEQLAEYRRRLEDVPPTPGGAAESPQP